MPLRRVGAEGGWGKVSQKKCYSREVLQALEKIARLARQKASPTKGRVGVKARTQGKIWHIGAQCPLFLIPVASLEGVVELMGHSAACCLHI